MPQSLSYEVGGIEKKLRLVAKTFRSGIVAISKNAYETP